MIVKSTAFFSNPSERPADCSSLINLSDKLLALGCSNSEGVLFYVKNTNCKTLGFIHVILRNIADVIEKKIMKSLEKDYLKNVGKYLYFYLTV